MLNTLAEFILVFFTKISRNMKATLYFSLIFSGIALFTVYSIVKGQYVREYILGRTRLDQRMFSFLENKVLLEGFEEVINIIEISKSNYKGQILMSLSYVNDKNGLDIDQIAIHPVYIYDFGSRILAKNSRLVYDRIIFMSSMQMIKEVVLLNNKKDLGCISILDEKAIKNLLNIVLDATPVKALILCPYIEDGLVKYVISLSITEELFKVNEFQRDKELILSNFKFTLARLRDKFFIINQYTNEQVMRELIN